MSLINAKMGPVISCTDIDRAVKFYTEVLGLKKVEEKQPGTHVLVETADGNKLLIYQRGEAPKAENTVLGFTVTGLEAVVEELKGKGVKFEEYDFPGLKTENSIATIEGYKSAWFKDPDGNIVSIGEMV